MTRETMTTQKLIRKKIIIVSSIDEEGLERSLSHHQTN